MDKELELQRKEKYRIANEPPVRTLGEEIANSISHGIATILAIIALVFMLVKSDTGFKIMAACFYGISIILETLMSCIYHALKRNSKGKTVLRRFDYATIYLLIGGTFAPILLLGLGGTLGVVLFCVQWGIIIIGITLTAVFGPGRFKIFTQIMYFCLGWSGILLLPTWIKNSDPILFWILGGGVIYTLGMIPFAKKGVKWMHFLWHVICIIATAVHFTGIFVLYYA